MMDWIGPLGRAEFTFNAAMREIENNDPKKITVEYLKFMQGEK